MGVDGGPEMSRRFYCAAFVLLLAAEVCIALYVHDAFVRPYLGDVLVIVLLYCFFRGVLGIKGRWLVPAVTGLGFLAEGAQYFRLADRLGLAEGSVLRAVLGSVFDWRDLLCYLAGGLLLAALERSFGRHRPETG